ncbi:hypothetical protein [Candidatus Methylomirabilis sp.]|uniref:hypothetical protein n=1 Tax=Candidatus Methylomirabilis sp. TaxID=2032687 RepID=UPI003076243E
MLGSPMDGHADLGAPALARRLELPRTRQIGATVPAPALPTRLPEELDPVRGCKMTAS